MKTIYTPNHTITIDKFMDIIYIDITSNEEIAATLIDNIMLHNKNNAL